VGVDIPLCLAYSMCGDPFACLNRMRLDFAICISILLAVLFIGTAGAFFLFVPVLGILTAVTLLLGLGLMFALGLIAGTRSRKLYPFSHRVLPIRRLPGNLSIVR
jgi:hypothetical protein